MNTELIKKKILDLAIRGKLVDQRPEEGTAEELYAQIQEEKRKLIAEVKIKKEKPLPEISEDEIPFDIPASWKWVRLNDGMIINPSVIADDEQETSFIPMADVESGYSSIINLKEKRIWKTVKKNFSRFENGDVLIAKITPCFQNRKSAIAENLVNGVGAGTTEFNVIRTNNNLLLNKFVLYFAKSEYFINYGQEHFTGTVGQQRFSGNAFYEMLFPLPPLSEQKRIVAKIEEIFSKIDVIEKAKADLAKDGNLLEKKILDLAIRGKLVEQRPEEGTAEDLYNQIQEEKKKLFAEGKIKKEKPLPEISEDEIPFDIPKSWKWVRLGNLISIKSGEGLVSSKMQDGNIPVYGGNGIAGYHNESLVNEETIVIGRVGVYCGSIHVTEKKAWVTDNAFITTYPKNYINMQFLVHWLNELNLGKNNNATAQPVVSGKKYILYSFLFHHFQSRNVLLKKLKNYFLIVIS